MKAVGSTLFLILLPLPLLAQTTVRGIVTEQNSGNKPIAGVQIKALGSAPETSDNEGLFQLTFASKKIGERIIVSEISKKGYEIVNKDVVNNWVIPGDRNSRTKVVMCPEGTLARNTMKYYDISLAGLTKGYNNRLRRLQAKLDSALIDARTFDEKAKALGGQYESSKQQLEELAARFARENFDDCPAIQKNAFVAFQGGNVSEALGILEGVNSEVEIAKAKQQKEKGRRLERESRDMQVQSDSIISQNIKKLVFQAELYQMDFRFDDAGKALETAIAADSSDAILICRYVSLLCNQNLPQKGQSWARQAVAAAKNNHERAASLDVLARTQGALHEYEEAMKTVEEELAVVTMPSDNPSRADSVYRADALRSMTDLCSDMHRFDRAGQYAATSVELERRLMQSETDTRWRFYFEALNNLSMILNETGRYGQAEEIAGECVAICRKYSGPSNKRAMNLLSIALENLGNVQTNLNLNLQAVENLTESLEILHGLETGNPGMFLRSIAWTLSNLAFAQSRQKEYASAISNQLEAVNILDTLVRRNPLVYTPFLATVLSNLADYYRMIGQPVVALPAYKRSLGLYKTQAVSSPQTFAPREVLVLISIASTYVEMSAADSMDNYCDEALELARGLARSGQPYHRMVLAHALNQISYLRSSVRLKQSIVQGEEALQIYLELAKSDSTCNSFIFQCSSRLFRYAMLAGEFTEAEKYARLYSSFPNALEWPRLYLAYCFLYRGKYDEARDLFMQAKNSAGENWYHYEEMVFRDFDEFEKAGITHPDVPKIRELLKTK
jgi:tetratricopeptide (TPR) repeat protein